MRAQGGEMAVSCVKYAYNKSRCEALWAMWKRPQDVVRADQRWGAPGLIVPLWVLARFAPTYEYFWCQVYILYILYIWLSLNRARKFRVKRPLVILIYTPPRTDAYISSIPNRTYPQRIVLQPSVLVVFRTPSVYIFKSVKLKLTFYHISAHNSYARKLYANVYNIYIFCSMGTTHLK